MYRWCALLLLLASLPMWGQTGSGTTASTGPQSIGDAVKTEDKVKPFAADLCDLRSWN